MKDLEPTNMILGMKISMDHREIFLSLSHSVEKCYANLISINANYFYILWLFNFTKEEHEWSSL